MSKTGYIAFDLGAESGRAMLATLENETISLEEMHRFPNIPLRLPSGLHWDITGLHANLIEGLKRCAAAAKERGVELISLGVDTWGVDFGLVGKSGQLLGLPFAYRDDRNTPAMEHVTKQLGEKRIYDATGIQFMFFNSLYQLAAQHAAEPELLKQTDRLLFVPDLLHYWLSGAMVNEATIASTSQMVNPLDRRDPHTGAWATDLLDELGLPTHMLGDIVPAGTKIGRLRQAIADELGITPIDVIAPGCHDTASAVAAVPVDTDATPNWLFLSSGTWSLMGAELDQPVVTDAARAAGFTNERGVDGKIRFLTNLAGLWLVQETRRDFAKRGQAYDYTQLTDMAAQAEAFRTLVDPGHAPFASPGDMPAKIAAFAEKTGQPAPESVGQFVRCCLESLAFAYRKTMLDIDDLRERQTDALHIVGGGGRNELLNQMAADALGIPVIVGPDEGTAMGNALTQAMGAGQVKDLSHLRRIVRKTVAPKRFEPRDPAAFEKHWQRYLDLLGK